MNHEVIPCNPDLPYSEELALQVCDEYLTGKTFAEIGRKPGYPPAKQIYRWLQTLDTFREKIERTRAARGIVLEDKILEGIDIPIGKDDVGGERLRFDRLRWAAEVNDPSRYGKKVTHAGDSTRPIQFIINTGFGEPNEWQRHPKLGADGLIIREVQHEIVQPDTLTPLGFQMGTQPAEGGDGTPPDAQQTPSAGDIHPVSELLGPSSEEGDASPI